MMELDVEVVYVVYVGVEYEWLIECLFVFCLYGLIYEFC